MIDHQNIKNNQVLRIISAEMDTTKITVLLIKQINALEALQLG